MVKIALDAGHGLYTAGKQTPDGIKEWTLNDKVRDKVVKLLAEYDVSIVNVDNDEGKVDESLTARVNKYINAGVSAFVSIHHNAYTGNWNGATGVEVYVDQNATDKDVELANLIYTRMVKNTGLKGRGVKRADFTVIYQNKVPAVLCEGGFMDGSSDYKLITSAAGQEKYAEAIADGLIEFLKLKKKAVPATTPATAPTKSVKILAAEVISGKWGNGAARKEALTKAGYDHAAVQAEVDRQLKNTAEPEPAKPTSNVPFIVKVNISNLNIRKGPGTNYSATGRFTGIGAFTIVEVKAGTGSNAGWGRLKSGAGWISLDFAKKL
jgi:N-acetylmuramoyl-L-alanine amidase